MAILKIQTKKGTRWRVSLDLPLKTSAGNPIRWNLTCDSGAEATRVERLTSSHAKQGDLAFLEKFKDEYRATGEAPKPKAIQAKVAQLPTLGDVLRFYVEKKASTPSKSNGRLPSKGYLQDEKARIDYLIFRLGNLPASADPSILRKLEITEIFTDLLKNGRSHRFDPIDQKWIPIKKRKGLENASYNAFITTAVCAFRFAFSEEFVPFDLSNKLPNKLQPNVRTRKLSPEELERLSKELLSTLYDQTFKDIVNLNLFCFPAREKELTLLKWSEVDFQNKSIHIPAERMKNRKRHVHHIGPYAFEILSRRFATRDPNNDSVFPAKKNGVDGYEINSQWSWLRKNSKIKDYTFHDNRRTFTSYKVLSGEITLEQAMIILSHSSIQMTMRYLGIDENDKLSASESAQIQKLFNVRTRKSYKPFANPLLNYPEPEAKSETNPSLKKKVKFFI